MLQSGTTSVHIVEKRAGTYALIKAIGSSNNPDEIERLVLKARNGQRTKDALRSYPQIMRVSQVRSQERRIASAFCFLAVLFVVANGFPHIVAADVSATNLLGQWNFTEGSGTTVADSSGLGNTMTSIDAPSWVPGAIAGSGIAFNGTSQYAKLATSSALNVGAGDFTVAVWAKINAGADQHNAFVAKNLAGACCDPKGYPGYFLGEKYGQIVFQLESDESGLDTVRLSASAAPYRGAWHHYAGVRQGDYVKLYIDGVLVASATLAGHYISSFNLDNGYPLAIGAVSYFTVGQYLDGAIDDMRVYKRGLMAGEIMNISRFEKRAIFPMYDNIGGYKDKPSPLWDTVVPISIIGNDINITEEQVRHHARVASKGKYLVIDIEPLDGLTNANLAKMKQIINWMRNENPDLKMGFYGVEADRNYWDPVSYDGSPNNATYRDRYNAWEAKTVALRALAFDSDFVTVSLYTFYNSQPGWQVYARENLAQAFQYGKPVLAYLMPRFHSGGQYKDWHFIPGDYWRMQLDFVKQQGGDGIVVWDAGAVSPTRSFDTTATWLAQTKDFVAKRSLDQVPSRKFTIGQRTTVSASATVYAAKAGTTNVGTQPAGMGGVVMMGTDVFSGTPRWHIDFDGGVDGWVDETPLAVEPPFNGLLAQWDFEETSDKAKDSTLHNYTAFPVSAPVRVAGKVGAKAISFNGTTQYLNAGNQTAFNFGAGDFTVAAWVKTDDATSQYKTFMAKNIANQNAYPGYFLGQYGGKVRFMLENTEGGTPTFAQATSTLQIGGWHHYAGVREGDSIKLYIDGVLAATSTLAGKYTTSFNVDNAAPITIGTAYSFQTNWMMNGSVDDARVYSVALTAEEVKNLFAPTVLPTPTPPVLPTQPIIPSTPVASSGGGGGGGGGGFYLPFVSSVAPPAAPAQSSSLSVAQRQSLIAELLAQVLELQKRIVELGGKPIAIPPGFSSSTLTQSAKTGVSSFTRNLKRGDRGEDVRMLQSFLNTHGFLITPSGDGSSGKETTYFGSGTVSVLIRFQNAYKSEILTPAGLSAGTGFFGTFTRKMVGEIEGR